MYTVKRTESQLWTVGEEYGNGKFYPCSDHDSDQEARDEATRLNGGTPLNETVSLKETVAKLLQRIDELEKRVETLEDADEPDDMYAEHQRMKRLMPDW